MDRALQESPHDFVVTEGLRTLDRQRELLRIGASTTMNSRHLTGHAVDLYAWVDINLDGKVVFQEMANPRLLTNIASSIKAAALAEGIPVIWGGDWRTFKDMPHFELDRRVYPV
jgi:peptidoglycan L-alanyl-D-glutamate endopeptidase CwlK